MSQLLKLLDKRTSIDHPVGQLKPSTSRSNSGTLITNPGDLNTVSNPYLTQPHTQTSTTTIIRASRPITKKKSSNTSKTTSGRSASGGKSRGGRSGSVKNKKIESGGEESSRSQSGCSVCDGDVRRSRSRSGGGGGGGKKIKKSGVFLEKLINDTDKSGFNQENETNVAVKSRSLLEDSTSAMVAAQPTLFDKYLVN